MGAGDEKAGGKATTMTTEKNLLREYYGLEVRRLRGELAIARRIHGRTAALVWGEHDGIPAARVLRAASAIERAERELAEAIAAYEAAPPPG